VGKRSTLVESYSRMSLRGPRYHKQKASRFGIGSVLGLTFSELNDKVIPSKISPTAFAKMYCRENVYGADKFVTHEVDGFTVTHRVNQSLSARTDSDTSMSDEARESTEATSKYSTIETTPQESTEELDLMSTFKFGFADEAIQTTSKLLSER